MSLKKIIIILLSVLMLLSGCENDERITVAVEKGQNCDGIINEIKSFYAGNEMEFVEIDNVYVSNKKYDVIVGSVNTDSTLGYGMWKSKPLGETCVCAVSYGEYKMTSDFSGKKAGNIKDFDYNDFLHLNSECTYEIYDDENVMLSDLKEGVIDVILCTGDEVDKFRNADENFRINELLDGNIYELCVISRDIKLIEKINNVIGD